MPRFAVVRWALGEDPDLWLPLRGRVSRSSPCAWCTQRARTYPYGPQKGALCVSCIGSDPGAFVDLPPEALAFLSHHVPSSPARRAPPLAVKTKVQTTLGLFGDAPVAPCVLCQAGANAIDHWLSYCPVAQLTWTVITKLTRPPLIGDRHRPDTWESLLPTYCSICVGWSQNMGDFVLTFSVSKYDPYRRMHWTYGSAHTNRYRLPSWPGFGHYLLKLTSIVLLQHPHESSDSLKHSWILPCFLIRVSALPGLSIKMRPSPHLLRQMRVRSFGSRHIGSKLSLIIC